MGEFWPDVRLPPLASSANADEILARVEQRRARWEEMTDQERVRAVNAVRHELARLAATIERWLPESVSARQGDRLEVVMMIYPGNAAAASRADSVEHEHAVMDLQEILGDG